jgi:hypothetical protein
MSLMTMSVSLSISNALCGVEAVKRTLNDYIVCILNQKTDTLAVVINRCEGQLSWVNRLRTYMPALLPLPRRVFLLATFKLYE